MSLLHHGHGKSEGAISWMAKNSVAANLLMVFLLVGGFFMATKIKQEVFPEFDLDTILISVPYPGAGPEEVERGILKSIEEKVRGLDGVKRVLSSAHEGSGTVTVELLTGANKDKALQDVKNNVDSITSFPQDAERPIVSIPTTRSEVIQVLLHGDFDRTTLRSLAEQLRDEFLRDEMITLVDFSGVPAPEIAIEVSQANLRRYKLTLPQIAAEVRRTAVELPGGGIKTSGGEVLLRTAERRDLAREFEDVALLSAPDGTTVRLSDIAEVREDFEDTDEAAFHNGQPAVMLRVYRVGDQTPVEVADAVRNRVEIFVGGQPDTVHVSFGHDWSYVYRERMNLLLRNAGWGLILVLIILGFFLEIRLAFWVTMGIPISFLGAMFFMPAMGVSINMISLFAFIMTLGIVVDDAIVVGENIYEMRQEGAPFMKAAIAGGKQVAVPVIFSVLTNIAAFMPMFFVPGTMGKIFRVIPAIVTSVFVISLVESLLILPAHLGHQRPTGPRGVLGWLVQMFTFIFAGPRYLCQKGLSFGIQRIYTPLIHQAASNRYVTMVVGMAILIVVLGAVKGGRTAVIFFPKVEGDAIVASAVLTYGSPLADAEAVQEQLVREAQKILDRHQKAEDRKVAQGVYTSMGSPLGRRGPHGAGATAKGSHLVDVQVLLLPLGERNFSSVSFAKEWRESVGEIAGLESLSFRYTMGPSGGSPVDVELSHRDTVTLEQAAASLAKRLKEFKSLKDIDDGFAVGKPQLSFKIRPEGRSLNIAPMDLGRQVRGAFYGAEALRQQRGRDEVKVMVRLPKSERKSEHDVETLLLRTATGGEIQLFEAATVIRGRAYTEINRADGRRVIDVTADMEEGHDPQAVMGEIRKAVMPALMADFPGLSYSLEGEERERRESFGALGIGFLLAMIVIYAMLAIPLHSYIQPVIIMVAIPFGIVGAVLGHMIMGYDLSLMTMMGLVALSGVVVNDSLVFIHATNDRRSKGMSPKDAVISAGLRRFRPIMLTSITTFGGLAPMIFETSTQAKFLIPMAIALGYGVLFATFITLVLIPAIYLIVDDLTRGFHWLVHMHDLDDLDDDAPPPISEMAQK
jgi:multidrug efflux pump subunit AcrB